MSARFYKNFLVTCTNIIGTDTVVYHVWVPCKENSVLSTEGISIAKFGDQWYYELRSKRLPRRLAALRPMSKERFQRVAEYQRRLERIAEKIICETFPDSI